MKTFFTRSIRQRQKTSPVEVTVYTRAGCCCCHKALDVLNDYKEAYHLEINTIDIDADPELARRYNTEVPVVALEGKVRFKGVVNRVLLVRLLEAEGRNTTMT
jgi:glutaredoxin